MYLRSIELADVALFSGAVSVGAFAPGLNLIAAPNEAGKSTVFRALETVFRHSHASRKQELQWLRPYGGGQPEISCVFSIEGLEWELQKRFLTSPTASLRRTDGHESYSDREVDTVLARILAGGGDRSAFFPVLWIGQMQSFELPQLGKDAHQTLSAVVEREAGHAAARQDVARIEAAVLKELQTFLTESLTRPRKNGPLDSELAALRNLEADLQQTRNDFASAKERLQRLDGLESRLRNLRDPGRRAAAENEISACQEQIKTWEAAAKHFAAARIADAAAREKLRLAKQKVSAIRTALSVDDAIAVRRAELESATASCGAARAAVAETHQLLKVLGEARANAELWSRRKRLLAAKVDTEERLRTAADQFTKVSDLVAQRELYEAEVASNAVTEDTAQQLTAWRNEVDRLDAQLEGASPTVTVDYDESNRNRLVANGVLLAGGEVVTVSAPLVIEVPTIGRLTIAPGNHSSLANLQEKRSQLSRRLAAGLADCGSPDFDALGERLSARRKAVAELRTIDATLATLAPGGSDAVRSLHQRLSDRLSELDCELEKIDETIGADRDGGETEAPHDPEFVPARGSALDLEDLDRKVLSAQSELAERQRNQSRSDKMVAELGARLEDLQKRRCEALELLNNEEIGADDLDIADAEFRSAEHEANEASRAVTVWRAEQPDLAAEQDVRNRLAMLQAGERERAASVYATEMELAAVQAQVSQDRQNGIAHRLREAEAAVAYRRTRVEEIETHVAALQLLLAELRAARARTAVSTLRPTIERLRDLATPIFGRDALTLEGAGPAPLRQNGKFDEPWSQLSGGTREQIAILARLAYAGVLADQGQPVPVILDDALVFSDEHRLRQMCEILARAAQHHQVIVLSCHEKRFQEMLHGFGAVGLTLEPTERSARVDAANWSKPGADHAEASRH